MRLVGWTVAFWFALGAAFTLLAMLSRWLLGSEPMAGEQALLRWLESKGTEPWLGVARVFTIVGTFAGLVPMAGIAVALLVAHSRRLAAYVATVVTGAGGYYLVFNRWLFARERPEIVSAPSFEGTSFPSGHAVVTTALVIAVIVAVIELRRRWASPALLFGACFVAAVLATRLYLLAHYPTDLIAGGVLGVSWALGTIWLWKRCSAVSERA